MTTCKFKTDEFDVIRWTGENKEEIKSFLGTYARTYGCKEFDSPVDPYGGTLLYIFDPICSSKVNVCDYIVKLPDESFRVYSSERFNKLFKFCAQDSNAYEQSLIAFEIARLRQSLEKLNTEENTIKSRISKAILKRTREDILRDIELYQLRYDELGKAGI